VSASLGGRRLAAVLLAVFSGVALGMASVGMGGGMSFSVVIRSRELGVRMALGASSGTVLRLVARQGMALVLLGVAIGVGGALGLTRLIASQLYAVRATDPSAFSLAVLVLVATALLAILVPALRATRLDPVAALREE
jgi:ABC-type antimicrobial peptide transport system permease subunit